MKRISIKMLLINLLLVVIAGVIMRVLQLAFFITDDHDVRVGTAFVATLLTLVLATMIYALIVDRVLVKRIKKLSNATKEIAKGNFDITLKKEGRDEISTLTDDFIGMSNELRANQFLSKSFIRNVSHEIKTPLVSISGFAELIEKETKSESIKEAARIIQEESERMLLMSREMLQISLLDSTTIISKNDTFKPAMQIRTIIANMQLEWEKKNIEFFIELSEEEITSNAQLLYQVWQNLISNAIKFSNEDGNIKISLLIDTNKIEFVIEDNGIGIKEEDKEEIFKHFYMGDKSRNVRGSGLGLPICKGIIDKLMGSISFESNVHSGTKFIVTLNRQ